MAEHLVGSILHSAQQGFRDSVGKRGILVFREVALHRVHHDVGSTGCRLIGRQRISALGIHDGELTATEVAVDAPLDEPVVFRDDTTRRHLGTGGGNRQHDANRQALLGCRLSFPEVPHVTLVGYTIGDGLCRVDDTAATDGEDKVYLFTAAETDSLFHFREQRVGHYPTQPHKGDACLVQHLFHFVEKPIATR